MSVKIAGGDIKNVMVGGVQAKTIRMGTGSGNVEVWSAKPTERITLDSGTGARDALRNALTKYGTTYQAVKELPFDIELVGAGSAEEMFSDCRALAIAPRINTEKVTSMWYMFLGCKALISAPQLNTGNVRDMSNMFQSCEVLTYVPDMATSNVSTISGMFYNCKQLKDGKVRLIGKKSGVNTSLATFGSGLTRVPFFDANGNPI